MELVYRSLFPSFKHLYRTSIVHLHRFANSDDVSIRVKEEHKESTNSYVE